MRTSIVWMLGALGLMACKENKPAEYATTTSTSGATQPAPVTIAEVQTVLLEKRPDKSTTIDALDIVNDNGIVTLRGDVPDQATRADLVNRVRAMPNVRGVKDELRVDPHSVHERQEQRE